MESEALDIVTETVTPATTLVNRDSPKATTGCGKLHAVGTTKVSQQGATGTNDISQATTTVARRLSRLLKYLDVGEAEFASAVGVSPSYVNRLLTGDRGQSGEVSKLALGAQRAYGVGGHYWSSKVDLDPAECKVGRPVENKDTNAEGEMGTLAGRQEFGAGAEARAELALQSARSGDPAEVVRQIMLVDAPTNASAAWWLKTYFELVRKYGDASK